MPLSGHFAPPRLKLHWIPVGVVFATNGDTAVLHSLLYQIWLSLRRTWREEQAQDIAEYAVMLAVILVVSLVAIRAIGGNANTVFSSVASAIQ